MPEFHNGKVVGAPDEDEKKVVLKNGKTYFVPAYGSLNGKAMPFWLSLLIIILLCVLLVFGGYALLTHKESATITKVDTIGTKEIFEYTFNYNGVSYSGKGEAEFIWSDEGYIEPYKLNESYPVFVHKINSNWHSFDDSNPMGIFLIIFSGFLIVFYIIGAIAIYKKRKKVFNEVGDVNGDGKANMKDILALDKKESFFSFCKYCGSELNELKQCENCLNAGKVMYCKYCGNLLDSNHFCTKCSLVTK